MSSRYGAVYIDSITLQDFRTFKKSSIDFVHPDASVLDDSEPPKLRNLNLVIGGNGSGKTTLLKGVALASLGPAVADSGLYPYHLVRRNAGRPVTGGALIEARYTLNPQDRKVDVPNGASRIESRVRVERRGDLERFTWAHQDEEAWRPIYSKSSDAFFFVGYGASRQVEKVERVDMAGRQASSFTRAQRIMLAWRNIVIARQRKNGTSFLARARVDVSKLDADQILLTELFGLRTTRSAAQSDRIRQLLLQSRQGDVGAARELMAELSGAES